MEILQTAWDWLVTAFYVVVGILLSPFIVIQFWTEFSEHGFKGALSEMDTELWIVVMCHVLAPFAVVAYFSAIKGLFVKERPKDTADED